MQFTPLVMCGFYLSIISHFILLNHLFIPRYHRRLNLCLSVISLFIMISIDLLNYKNPVIRPFLAISLFFIIAQTFYLGSILQKAIVAIFVVPAGVICELPFDIFVTSVLRIDLLYITQTDYFFIVQCIITTIFSIVLYYLSISLKKLFYIMTKHTYVILALVSSFFSSILMISQVQLVSISNLSMHQHMIFIFVMFIISLTCNILLLYFIKTLYKQGKAELTMRRLESEYRVLLDEYVDTNDELYRYIRHDLMNYMVRNKK